jgi:hypothetical protein
MEMYIPFFYPFCINVFNFQSTTFHLREVVDEHERDARLSGGLASFLIFMCYFFSYADIIFFYVFWHISLTAGSRL